jgi:hypothetical protein
MDLAAQGPSQGSGFHATFLSQLAFISSGVAGLTLWRHIGGR